MKHFFLILFSAMLTGICFTSCSDDDDFSNVDVTNSELLTILQEKGYTFTNEGQLILNDMALNTTSLDLSGTKISDLSDLDVLPSLTEVDLSDNGYSPTFDFSELPSNITGVDLTGNDIYEFKGLVNVEIAENEEETVTELQSLTKLYLPATAKYDCSQLVYFYEQNESEIEAGTVDMEMIDASGSLTAYNTLREVPNDDVRTTLKDAFPSLFDDDKINLSNRMRDIQEQSMQVLVNGKNPVGCEYVFGHRDFLGGSIAINATDTIEIPYFKINPADSVNLATLVLTNVNTPNGIDISNFKSFIQCVIKNNDGLESIDFSASELLGQRAGVSVEFAYTTASYIWLQDCDNLASVKFPDAATKCSIFYMISLPKLTTLDLSQFDCMWFCTLGDLANCDLTYFTPKSWLEITSSGYELTDNGSAYFTISEDVYNKQATKNFLDKYHDHCINTGGINSTVSAYNWTADYND